MLYSIILNSISQDIDILFRKRIFNELSYFNLNLCLKILIKILGY